MSKVGSRQTEHCVPNNEPQTHQTINMSLWGAFSKDSVQETPNVRKSDPVIYKFRLSEALNFSELTSKIVSSLGKNALEFLIPLTLKWAEIMYSPVKQ